MTTGYLLHLIGGEAGYQRILREQGGGCAICGRLPAADEASFHIDHDHSTGLVRGVLCLRCNVGLGYFLDDDDSLEQAIAYLRHWREEHASGRAPRADTSGPRRRAELPGRGPQRSALPKSWKPERIVPRAERERYQSALAMVQANGI